LWDLKKITLVNGHAHMRAMAEVSGPIVAIALVLCAVFVPTAFIVGLWGEFYKQFEARTIAQSGKAEHRS
jgi:multidrug efflux pump